MPVLCDDGALKAAPAFFINPLGCPRRGLLFSVGLTVHLSLSRGVFPCCSGIFPWKLLMPLPSTAPSSTMVEPKSSERPESMSRKMREPTSSSGVIRLPGTIPWDAILGRPGFLFSSVLVLLFFSASRRSLSFSFNAFRYSFFFASNSFISCFNFFCSSAIRCCSSFTFLARFFNTSSLGC